MNTPRQEHLYILYIVTIRIYYRALYSKLNRTGTYFYFHTARYPYSLPERFELCTVYLYSVQYINLLHC